jgi:hypothetical protein
MLLLAEPAKQCVSSLLKFYLWENRGVPEMVFSHGKGQTNPDTIFKTCIARLLPREDKVIQRSNFRREPQVLSTRTNATMIQNDQMTKKNEREEEKRIHTPPPQQQTRAKQRCPACMKGNQEHTLIMRRLATQILLR